MIAWGQIILLVLQVVNNILDYLNTQKLIQSGYDKAIADMAKVIMSKTAAGKAIVERIDALTEDEVDKELRDLEPSGSGSH